MREIRKKGITFSGRRLVWSDTVRSTYWDSWSAFVADAACGVDRAGGSAVGIRNYSWDFGAGWDGALNLARCGWSDGMRGVRELSASALSSVVGMVKKPGHQFDVAGDYYDVGRVVEGNPECAVRFVRGQKETRVVRVVVTLSVSYKVTAEEYRRRGAAVLALVDALEMSGVRCEVVIGEAVSSSRGMLNLVGCCLKAASDPVDVDLLAFGIAHPAVLRRICFGLCEGNDGDWRKAVGLMSWGNYGYPATYSLPDDGGEVVNVPVLNSRDKNIWRSDESMLAWLKSTIKGKVLPSCNLVP